MSVLPQHAALGEPLRRWFRATLDALEPARATHDALAAGPPPEGPAPAILAIGKAATGMAAGAVVWLADHRRLPAGGVVISHEDRPSPHPRLTAHHGDHPVPGARSAAAAVTLADTIAALDDATPVEVFLSGGTSALVAAPVAGVTAPEMVTAFELFHRMGLPIHAMNALRRRLTRWSGGRLAVALAPRPVRAWVISDVLDNDLSVIGSGPLVTEAVDPTCLGVILRERDLAVRLPASVITALATPPPTVGMAVPHRLVADRHSAARAAAAAIRAEGGVPIIHDRPLQGDTVETAAELIRTAWRRCRQRSFLDLARRGILVTPTPPRATVHLWTGETTIALPDPPGHGGRAQQFALAAARELHRIGRGLGSGVVGFTLLAAGTDGRDGPTDAAGAVIDGRTWGTITAAGGDPERALLEADAHPALDRVGALLRTGPTGTNLADLVMLASWE